MKTTYGKRIALGAAASFLGLAPPEKSDAAPPPSVAWQANLQGALKLAKHRRKPALIYFHAAWCGPCLLMESKAWMAPQVVRKSRAFIPVKIDLEEEPDVAARYRVQAPPTIIVVAPGGKILKTSTLSLNTAQLTSFLQAAITPNRKSKP